MKFKKLRLLALAMTVAVATSAMPSVAFAEDFTSAEPEEVVEVTEVFDAADAADVAAQESDAYQVDPATIKWDFDEVAAQKIAKEDQSVKVTWTEKHVDGATGDPYDLDKKVTEILKITEPGVDPLTGKVNCLAPGYVWFTTVIDGQVYNSGDPNDPNTAFVWRYAPDHKWVEVERKVIKAVKCDSTEKGQAHVWYECSVCGEKYDTDVDLEIPDHEWSENKVRYIPINNITIVNGKPELTDVTMDGQYTEETYRVCTKCGLEEIIKDEDKEILATKGVKAYVTDQEGIADDLIGLQYSEENQVPAWNEIELTDCTKDGYYEVTFFTYEDKPISHEWIKVPAHHMTKDVQVEFIHPDDVKQCVVTYNADRTGYTIVNQHCTDPVTYYEVVHCYAKGCPNKACADDYYPANDEDHYTKHEVTRTEKVVEASGDHIINNDIYKQVAALTQPVDYTELAEICAHDTVYVKLSVNNATCTENGSVKVEYICKLCKNVIKTQTVATKALGHVPLKAVAEVDENGNMIGELPTCEKEGWYNAVIYCKRCGEELARRDHVRIPRLRHSNEIEVTQAHPDGSDEIIVNDDVKNELNNTPRFEWTGYVVVDLNGSLLTDPSAANYKKVHDEIAGAFGDDKDEVLTVWADAVTYCNLLDHDHHKVVLEDDNVAITVVSVEKQGKDCQPGKIVLRATYDNKKTGKDKVVVSEDKEFRYYTSLETYRGRTAHDPLDPVKENEVAPTGTTAGSYDLVTYCRVCGAELSRETKSYEHECVAGEAVQENYKDATCTEAGSYDEVTYCTLCNKELSRETKTIEAKGHQFGEFEEVERVEPTALKDGYVKTARTCEICGISEEETEVLPATGDYTVPAKVTNIKTTANEGKQKIRVEYAAVKDAEKYRIYWKAHGDASYQKKDTANLSYTISGLTPNTLYDIRVRAAKKVDGEWVWGTTSGVYRRWLKTVATEYTKTSDSITVNITPVEGAVKYQIHISEYKDMTDETVKSVKSTTTAYTIKGLDPATKYYIRVRPITTADGKNYTGALNAVKGVKTKK